MSFDVDCEQCVNYEDDSVCFSCIHNPEFDNFYDPATPESIAKREAGFRTRFLDSISKEEVSIELSQEFKKAFETAWRFTPDVQLYQILDYRLCFVYCGEGFLMATDSVRLLKISVPVPLELVGKCVVWDADNDKFYIRLDQSGAGGTVVSKKGNQFLAEAERGTLIACLKSELPLENREKDTSNIKSKALRRLIPDYVAFNKTIVLNKQLLNDLLSIFPDSQEIKVVYKGKHDAIKFVANGIEAIILPVRVN